MSIKDYEDLIKLQDKYIKLLCKDLNAKSQFAHFHGIQTPIELIVEGEELRAKIKESKKNIKKYLKNNTHLDRNSRD